MSESFFSLSKKDQLEVIEHGRDKTGRPSHLIEKDIWVVWALQSLFESRLKSDLTFKGGTSLSKAYKIIDRFSEDIDLTYDIRKLIPDIINSNDLPNSRSQAEKWTKTVRDRLPSWIMENVLPVVMDVARTFWEKATAAHVFCVQEKIRGERYARHWHDLIAIANSNQFTNIISNKKLANIVAKHKSYFFREKDKNNQVVDYIDAVNGNINLVPKGDGACALANDYAAMIDDNVLVGNALPFEELLQKCQELERMINTQI